MPATTFLDYTQAVEALLNKTLAAGEVVVFNLQVDSRSPLRGFIAGQLQLPDASELHFREFIDISQAEPRLMYVYHYQDVHHQLIFRYDNAAHRPALAQPDHKHTPAGVEISSAPTLAQVILETTQNL